jgi:uncharacterized protein (TIGR03083 family)
MNENEVWQHIDTERARFADLLDDLTEAEWETPSLCTGWRVREVAAHLTLSQTGAGRAMIDLLKAGGNMNRMIHDTAVRRATLPVQRYGVPCCAIWPAPGGRRRACPILSR